MVRALALGLLLVATTGQDRADALRRRADLSYVEPSAEDRRAAELARLVAEPPPEREAGWFSPLSPAEKVLQGAFLGLGLVDWGQTVNFTQNPALRATEEINPVLGRRPSRARVNVLVPLGLAAHTAGVIALPRPWRNVLQVAGLVGEGLAVGNNAARGISPVWPWKTW